MSSEMSNLRKEDLSLYHYIKETVLVDFIETEEDVTLCRLDELCTFNSYVYEALTSMVPSPTDRGRGWVYFDTVSGTDGNICAPYNTTSGTRADGVAITAGTPEQSDMVTVYDSLGNTLPDTTYMIDYIDGRIITDGVVEPATVDYSWYYVSVVDEWSAVEAADPPVVVIDMHGTDKAGYQLGAGKKVGRKVDIHIFASNPAERNDIVERLYDGLYIKSCPLYDFPTGDVLDYDGTFYGRRDNTNKLTSLFSRETVDSIIGSLEFENVTARHVNLPLLMTRTRDEVVLSDLNAYRSKVSFDMFSYTNV